MMVAPPGEPSASTGLAVLQHDRRRDRRARPLARARQVRVVDGRVGRGEGEVGQLVVEQEAAARHGDAAAAGLLDGQGVRRRRCPTCRRPSDAWCSRPRTSSGRPCRRCAQAAGSRGSPGASGLVSTASSLIRHAARVGEPLRQQLLRRHVLEGRVADPASAVGEGDPARLDVAVQVLRLARLREVGPLQDVERLADASCRRRRTAPCRRRRGRGTTILRGRLALGPVGRQVLRASGRRGARCSAEPGSTGGLRTVSTMSSPRSPR